MSGHTRQATNIHKVEIVIKTSFQFLTPFHSVEIIPIHRATRKEATHTHTHVCVRTHVRTYVYHLKTLKALSCIVSDFFPADLLNQFSNNPLLSVLSACPSVRPTDRLSISQAFVSLKALLTQSMDVVVYILCMNAYICSSIHYTYTTPSN